MAKKLRFFGHFQGMPVICGRNIRLTAYLSCLALPSVRLRAAMLLQLNHTCGALAAIFAAA